jgi:hypothetical protein
MLEIRGLSELVIAVRELIRQQQSSPLSSARGDPLEMAEAAVDTLGNIDRSLMSISLSLALITRDYRRKPRDRDREGYRMTREQILAAFDQLIEDQQKSNRDFESKTEH